MDETKVQIGEDVLLDIGTHSDWYISSIGYDGESVNVELRRKEDRNKWWLADTPIIEEEPQTHCPIAIIFSCDECPHQTNCEYKIDCKRCRHFATDICRECYGNELFDESGYITEMTNIPQTERSE